MRAAVLYSAKTPLVIEDVELDTELHANSVLVRVTHAGVCHSDYHVISGDVPAEFPIVLGHEGAGIVEKVGAGVTRLQAGDHVSFNFGQFCGYCRQCNSGHPNLCDNRAALRISSRRNQRGDVIHDFAGTSCFAEYTVVHESGAIKVPSDIPLDRVALVSCGVMTGVGAVVNTAKVMPGETVAVIGCGGVGLNVIQGARLANAATIIAIDVHDNKLEMATTFGATHIINGRKEDAVKRVREIVPGGVDYAFEVIGLTAAIEQIYAMIRKGGTAIIVGMAPANSKVSLPALSFMLEEKTLRGTFSGGARAAVDIPRYLELYRSNRLRLDELITRHWKLEEINEAFDAMLTGEAARGIIDM